MHCSGVCAAFGKVVVAISGIAVAMEDNFALEGFSLHAMMYIKSNAAQPERINFCTNDCII